YAFDVNVWLCTFLSIMLLGFLQSLFNGGSVRRTFAEVFQYLRILMSDVMTKRYKKSSIRCLNGVWFLFSIVFLSAFTGCVFTFMTKGVEYSTIDSLEDLLSPSWSHLNVSVVDKTSPYEYLSNAKADDELVWGLKDRVSPMPLETNMITE